MGQRLFVGRFIAPKEKGQVHGFIGQFGSAQPLSDNSGGIHGNVHRTREADLVQIEDVHKSRVAGVKNGFLFWRLGRQVHLISAVGQGLHRHGIKNQLVSGIGAPLGVRCDVQGNMAVVLTFGQGETAR